MKDGREGGREEGSKEGSMYLKQQRGRGWAGCSGRMRLTPQAIVWIMARGDVWGGNRHCWESGGRGRNAV